FERRRHLANRNQRVLGEYRGLELIEGGQGIRWARQQSRRHQSSPVLSLGLGTHLEKAADLSRPLSHAVQPHQFLQSMHVCPLGAHHTSLEGGVEPPSRDDTRSL